MTGELGDWESIPDRFRARGLRWTTQRATLVRVLTGLEGHVTGSQIVDRCRAADSSTTPSTVYRTLTVLEELGFLGHSHGLDGREEFHLRPAPDHGHLACRSCGERWELPPGEVAPFIETLWHNRGFVADLDHLMIVGLCRECARS